LDNKLKNINNDRLISLIEKQVLYEAGLLFEQEPGIDDLASLDSVAANTPEDDAIGGEETPTGGDEKADGGEAVDVGGTEEGGDAGDPGLDVDGEEEGGDEAGMDLGGGGFGGGGGSGGGFDFGGDEGDGDEETDTEEEEPSKPPPSAEDYGPPADPVQSTVEIAVNMLEETGDDQEVLNAVKASIQQNFADFNEAAPVIQQLWDTDNPILKVVARKLLLFIHGR
jgi:hypothetical protein